MLFQDRVRADRNRFSSPIEWNFPYFAFGNTAWYNNQPDGPVYIGNVLHRYKGQCEDSFTVKDGTVSISAFAFDWDSVLADIFIPYSVKKIEDYAICGQWDQCTIHGYSNTAAEEYALSNGLNFVSLGTVEAGECGKSVTYLYNLDTSVLTISGTGDMADYSSAYTAQPWYAHKGSITSVVVEDGVTGVGSYAFSKMTALSSVSLSLTVSGIGIGAFSGCKALSQTVLPDGIREISDYAFYNCTALQSVNVPEAVVSIGDGRSSVFHTDQCFGVGCK